MTVQGVFTLADKTLNGVVDQINGEQWSMTMPTDFQTTVEGPITLREVISKHAYEDAWVGDMLEGKTMDEVGTEAYKGDLLGDTPKENFTKYVDAACAAVKNFNDLERTVHCSFGDFSAHDFLLQSNFFRGLRAHDIAKAIGVNDTLPDELVTELWKELEPVAEEWRAWGVFGPKVEVADNASLQDKLLGLTGRQPS